MPIWQPSLNTTESPVVGWSPDELGYQVRQQHQEIFGIEAGRAALAPATWTMIGEHTDYSGGVVLASLSQWGTAVAVSEADGDVVDVAWVGDAGVDKHSISVDEVAERAAAQQAGVDVHGRSVAPPRPEGGIAARLGGLVWTMIHRQMLSRDTRGLKITVVSTIPGGCGLGEDAAVDVAAALALYAEPVEEAPVAARLAEICTQAAAMFNSRPPLRARYTAALRGEEGRTSLIDYSDGSVSQIPHPASAHSGLEAFAVCVPSENSEESIDSSAEVLRRQRFIDEATRAFSVESLRLLPDSTQRVPEWLKAVHEVNGSEDFASDDEARAWLTFWEEETQRSLRVASALRSRRNSEIASLLETSQRSLHSYGLTSTDTALAQLCLQRGALSARSADAGSSTAVIVLIDASKAHNFSADLSNDGFLVVPLGHGEAAHR